MHKEKENTLVHKQQIQSIYFTFIASPHMPTEIDQAKKKK